MQSLLTPCIARAVESAMGVTTNLYVRHSLPLLQAREAMVAGKVKVSCTEVLGRMHATEWCVGMEA